jgi:ATP-dependent DNA helicase RecG
MAGLMLTFRANPAHMQTVASEQGALTTPITTPITTRLMALLLANPGISQQELAVALGLTRDGIKYHLDKMKRDGVIRHVGPARGGRWEVN